MTRKLTHKMRKAMTLVEMLVALTVTAMVGAAAMVAAKAISNARARSSAYTQTIQTSRASLHHIERSIRGAKLILAAGDGSLVLWTGDVQQPGVINADELAVIRYKPADRTITQSRVEFLDNMSAGQRAALNAEIDINDALSASSALQAVGNSAFLVEREIASDVETFVVTADPAVPQATIVRLDARFGSGRTQLELNTSVAPRMCAADLVELYEEGWGLLQEGSESDGDDDSEFD